ncbi:hypothetical protein DCCM_4533 [Desulfocucumis palustris]|uniref:DnaB/C C-terminal domain-containing protein n=1 Tax=Desulfocucumis palustris TaxID=1898651 RepID=A0A2L2XM54_9FIRM|nr:DnaD domain protein [Desulfocucumis palustris]GBF35406.1 hypothetical protein DCCM_4533 [Desulfocucumis palustris]
MSEIVRGRTKGYLTIENHIEDGLLEIGSIDLAGFYGALKRFVDRRENEEGKSAMPWTVDYFCNKFKIGKQRFYRLSGILWQIGLLDVEKDIGIINPKNGTRGWRNRYVVHDYADYEGPLRKVREGSYKYKKETAEDESGDVNIQQEEAGESNDVSVDEVYKEGEDLAESLNKEVFPYRNTPKRGIPTTGIPTTEIPVTGIPTAGIPTVERHIKYNIYKKQDHKKQTKETTIHSAIHHDDDNIRAGKKEPVDIVDNSDGHGIKKILTNAGFEGTPIEMEYIAHWINTFSHDMIKYAVDKSVLNGKRSLPYIGGIFEDWLKKGVKTIKQAKSESRYDSVLLKLKET